MKLKDPNTLLGCPTCKSGMRVTRKRRDLYCIGCGDKLGYMMGNMK